MSRYRIIERDGVYRVQRRTWLGWRTLKQWERPFGSPFGRWRIRQFGSLEAAQRGIAEDRGRRTRRRVELKRRARLQWKVVWESEE